MKKFWTTYVLMAGFVVASSGAIAQQEIPEESSDSGPPSWVLNAWESGQFLVVPAMGPPAWGVEAWQCGEHPTHPFGPPPWIIARQETAERFGLAGPPQEVREAWRIGMGFDLPGPPDFIGELFRY